MMRIAPSQMHIGPQIVQPGPTPTPILPRDGGALVARRFNRVTVAPVERSRAPAVSFAQYLTGLLLAAMLAWAGPAGAQTLAQAAPGVARAGVAAAVRGDVQLAVVPGVREIGKNVTSGDAIFLGDRIATGAEGRLQIMLLDETVFTIGPNAALTIDQFVYDPQTNAGKVTASVLKGAFRFVSGKVAKREPSDMEVRLPVGSIGVRGTSVAGETDGTRATIVLLGPGPSNDSSERVGRILVSGVGPTGAATTVEVVRSGFGTEITGANTPPTPPARIDPARLAALTAPLAGTAPQPAPAPGQQGGQQQGGQPAPQPGQQGGEQQGGQPAPGGAPPPAQAVQGQTPPPPPGGAGQAVGSGPGILAQAGSNIGAGLQGVNSTTVLAPNGGRPVVPPPPPPPPPPTGVPDGVPTREQLRTLSGTAFFESNYISLTAERGAGTGHYNYRLDVDFNNRTTTTTVTGNYSLGTGTPITGTINLNKTSSGGSDGLQTGSGPIDTSPFTLNNNNAGLTAVHLGALSDNPRNANGKVAAFIDLKLQIFDGTSCASSTNCVSGAKANVPRQ